MGKISTIETDNISEVTEECIVDFSFYKKMQAQFCELVPVFALCTDWEGIWLNEFTGEKEAVLRILEALNPEQMISIVKKVAFSKLEDIIIEDTYYPNIKLAAVSIKYENKPIFNWLVCCVLEDVVGEEDYAEPSLEGFTTTITQERFTKALDFLHQMSSNMLKMQLDEQKIRRESQSFRSSEKELKHSLLRTEAMAEIVQFLDYDEAVEELVAEILRIAGNYLQVESAQMFRLRRDNQHMEMWLEWMPEEGRSYFTANQEWKRSELFVLNKPFVITPKTQLSLKESEAFAQTEARAAMIFPVYINGQISMYVTFWGYAYHKDWTIEEIKFASDSVKVIQSILVRRIQKHSLTASYASLETILNNIGCSVYVRDNGNGEILFGNQQFYNELTEEFRLGTLGKIFEKTMKSEEIAFQEVCYVEREKWYDVYKTKINWMNGGKASLFAIYEVTERKIYQKKIEEQANTDFLTGLFNRMCFERDLAGLINIAIDKKEQGAVFYMDLDDFKHINDGLGHKYGDILLQEVAKSLKSIRGIEHTCYRIGGDEFVIIVPPGQFHRYYLIQEEIRDFFNRPWLLKDDDYYCTMSMGSVIFPDEGETVGELVKKSDIAMYEAKRGGKNRIAEYSDKNKGASHKRLDMEKSMRDATADGYRGFEVYYQPIIDIQQEGTPCVGAEALIRWRYNDKEYVPPTDFIPLAEYLGLINPIGTHVLKEACKACCRWNETEGHPEFKVNVNLSVIQLLQSDVVEVVQSVLQETNITPHNLTLEVTESLAINDMERMKRILEEIKQLGVRIALDDFGTGYSSLNHIKEIPLDVIKVDQTFVSELAEDHYSQSFIKMVSELAATIGVNICVEGIETREQYKVLEDMKVSMVQGYYFDRPMPLEEFEERYL